MFPSDPISFITPKFIVSSLCFELKTPIFALQLYLNGMNTSTFTENYREAFGEHVPLPVLFFYSNVPLADTEKTGGCFFKNLQHVREGIPASLNADVIGCGGGKFYTGFTAMPAYVPHFVSNKERYKQTPEMVLDHIRRLDVRTTGKKYLNFVRIDQAGDWNEAEGLLFFATPDVLSGLCAWAFYDNNSPDAVVSMFGSGCSTVISLAVQENRNKGDRTFLGLLDPSVRPYVGEHELSFVIPFHRFQTMYGTMRQCCLFGTHAWNKVKERINRSGNI